MRAMQRPIARAGGQRTASCSHHPQGLALHAQRRTHRPCRAAATQGDSDASILRLPLFPLPTVLHPAQSGTLLVFEPRYLELFRSLQRATPPGTEPRFGHILAGSSAPPVMMEQAVAGLPPLGVCAAVKSVQELSNGQLQVCYQGLRRFKLLTVDDESQPYTVAAATWLDDELAPDAARQRLVDDLELDVLRMCRQVARYSQQLAAAGSSGGAAAAQALPDALLTYAPPPPDKQSVAEYLTRAGVPAGGRIATWQRLGSVYGSGGGGGGAGKKKALQDPYQVVRDQSCKERRQELFSFAAASMLELGLPERLALLQSRDTAARLQFVAAAVAPHLQDLVARVSVASAFAQP